MSTGGFAPGGESLEGRQFARTLDEALSYADTDLSKVAILRARVDRRALESIDFSTSIDPFIFRNGVYTVQPGSQSQIFHAGLRGIDRAY
jgi:filamentous hemagglutinin